jgi:hypothetical protein
MRTQKTMVDQVKSSLSSPKRRSYDSFNEYKEIISMINGRNALILEDYLANDGVNLDVNSFKYKDKAGKECTMEHPGSLLTYAIANGASADTVLALLRNSNVDLTIKLDGKNALELAVAKRPFCKTICNHIVRKFRIAGLINIYQSADLLAKIKNYDSSNPNNGELAMLCKGLIVEQTASNTTVAGPKQSVILANPAADSIKKPRISATTDAVVADSGKINDDVRAASTLLAFTLPEVNKNVCLVNNYGQVTPPSQRKNIDLIDVEMSACQEKMKNLEKLRKLQQLAVNLEDAIKQDTNIIKLYDKVSYCSLVELRVDSTKKIQSLAMEIMDLTNNSTNSIIKLSEIYNKFKDFFPASFLQTAYEHGQCQHILN